MVEAEPDPFTPDSETWGERVARRFVEGTARGDARRIPILRVAEIPDADLEAGESEAPTMG